MKKIIIAIMAVFAMGSVAMAQVEMNGDNVKLNLNEEQVSMVSQYLADAEQDGFTLEGLQDFSFNTENGVLEFNKNTAGNNPVVGAILAIFLGDFGIHHFYTGDTKHGLLHLLFFWTGIPGLIGLIEGIIWLVDESSFPKTLFQMF